MDYTSNEILLQGLRNGDTAAYDYLHHSSIHAIRSLFENPSNNKRDIEDLYNESIILLLDRIRKPAFAVEVSIQKMLYFICYNKKLNIRRKEKNEKEYLDEHSYLNRDSNEASREEDADQELFDGIYKNSFNKLKEECQKILKKHFKDYNSKKIAEDLGLTAENVRKKISRCKDALNDLLKKDPEFQRLQKNNEIP